MTVQSAHAARPRLLPRLIHAAREQRLFVPGQHLLVAVSGGPDSTALLALLIRLAPAWRLRLTVVHVNYRLRGAESDEDEAFVSAFCKDRQVPLVVLRPVLVKQRRQSSLQAVAREARYDAMKSLAKEIGADRIVLGHTADDQAETMLMWMLRGAGLTGLAGMPSVRESIIVRPLLSVTREEILAYLDKEHLKCRQDSSNRTDRYRRNRIRNELLPAMAKISPSVVTLMQRQAELLHEDNRYLEQVTRAHFSSLVKSGPDGEHRFDRRAFISLPTALQRRLVRMMLRRIEPQERAPSAHVVAKTCRFFLTGRQRLCVAHRDVVLNRDGESLGIGRREPGGTASAAATPDTEVPVSVPSSVHWARTGAQFHVQELSRRAAEPLLCSRSRQQALFDADLVGSPLVLRCWRAGDRIHPSGMKGKSKKLQDLFADMKIARAERESIPILAGPEGILWVAGVRQDERFLVHDGTRRCLVVTMIDRLEEKGAQ